jgi:hypothetical protein
LNRAFWLPAHMTVDFLNSYDGAGVTGRVTFPT